MRKVIETTEAPQAIGPYSQGIIAAGCVWVSGQVALDPSSGALVEGGIEEQTRQVLKNLKAVLAAAGSDLDRAIRVTVYLQDMGDFQTVNRIYGEAFADAPPARVTVEVARLPLDARVEMDVVALAG
jgi:2-iminobutanoate/2-iminopropanoate deaminase